MQAKASTIELDEAAADALRLRAAERGVSISQLVTELVTLDAASSAIEPEDIAELDRRWAKVEAGTATVPHDDVVRWLNTWGTPAFRSWRDR
jgi:predicted transcriptional regulator